MKNPRLNGELKHDVSEFPIQPWGFSSLMPWRTFKRPAKKKYDLASPPQCSLLAQSINQRRQALLMIFVLLFILTNTIMYTFFTTSVVEEKSEKEANRESPGMLRGSKDGDSPYPFKVRVISTLLQDDSSLTILLSREKH